MFRNGQQGTPLKRLENKEYHGVGRGRSRVSEADETQTYLDILSVIMTNALRGERMLDGCFFDIAVLPGK